MYDAKRLNLSYLLYITSHLSSKKIETANYAQLFEYSNCLHLFYIETLRMAHQLGWFLLSFSTPTSLAPLLPFLTKKFEVWFTIITRIDHEAVLLTAVRQFD